MQWWRTFEKHPKACLYFSVVWLFLICGLAFLWQLGSTGLVDETEPLFAEAARQMVETGNWVTPYFNGETRFDKPPLVYWLMAMGYQLLGTNEWAVRLPSALSAIALVIVGFLTLRTFGSVRSPSETPLKRQLWLSGWLGAAMMALNPQTLAWARIGVSDMLLSGCMGCALFCFFWGYVASEGKQGGLLPNRWYLAFYVLLSLAVLTKGPVGIVIPGLTVLAFLLYLGNFWRVLREMGILVGGLIFLGLTVPWYVLVILENGRAYIDSFFGYHNVERFTEVVNGHGAPWYFYFAVVLVGFLPWSVYLPLAIARLKFWRRSLWRRQPRSTHLGLFALAWFASIFIFFTIAVTKLPSYTLPLIPAASILVALFWSEILTEAKPRKSTGFWLSGIFNVVLLLALAIASFYSPQLIGYDPVAPNFGERFGQTAIPLRSAILWTAVSGTIALLLRQKKAWRGIVSVNLIGFAAFVLFVGLPALSFVDLVRQQPIRELAAIATQAQQSGEELLMAGFKKPSIVFYTQRPVRFFYGESDTRDYLKAGDNPQSPTVLLLTQSSALANSFNLSPNQYENLGQSGAYQLIRIRKQAIAQP